MVVREVLPPNAELDKEVELLLGIMPYEVANNFDLSLRI
jgi:hypothetical protein